MHEVVVTTFKLIPRGRSTPARRGPLAWLYARLPGAKPAGHPAQALTMGDTLGLDLYVVTESTPLDVITPSTRIAWKEETLDYWQRQARITDARCGSRRCRRLPGSGRRASPSTTCSPAPSRTGAWRERLSPLGRGELARFAEWMATGSRRFEYCAGAAGPRVSHHILKSNSAPV